MLQLRTSGNKNTEHPKCYMVQYRFYVVDNIMQISINSECGKNNGKKNEPKANSSLNTQHTKASLRVLRHYLKTVHLQSITTYSGPLCYIRYGYVSTTLYIL